MNPTHSPLTPSTLSTLLAPLALAAGAALLAGCTILETTPGVRRVVTIVEPYQPDIIQGNVVTREQIALVKPGMSRAQVRDILGTPLVADPFHADRWDYVFTMQRQGIAPVKRAFTLRFEKDAVSKIEAPDLPSDAEFVESISVRPVPTSVPKLELTDAEREKLPTPQRAQAPATAASGGTGPQRTYPPLEPQ